MKLRYYMRGLGIGILVTAIVMGIAMRGKQETLSDAQIRERALALGMVDASPTVLSDLQGDGKKEPAKEEAEPTKTQEPTKSTEPTKAQEPTKSTEPTKTQEPTKSTEPTKTQEPTKSTEPTKTQEPTKSTEPTKTQEPTKSTEPTKTQEPTSSVAPSTPVVTIVIKSGSGSDTVSRTLAEAGLVADAKAYDKYLCDNGYSKGLHAGTYEIPVGATEEEIANMIATKR